ncbi:secreted RxLR effector protein 161-like [Capsicum annuum]|uniref:secreted RxLR effector protein 161-like n=1 Tax=Capsicum annuum TaxID=4072 RepID=UPI001FB0D5F5|nr:secreted RxLR effector protein 161-like [Capsicum annuum]
MKDIPYTSIVESLMYAQTCRRTDISFAVGMLGRYQNMVGYSDSDNAGCVDIRKSIFGYLFFLAGGAISWKSAKQSVIAASIMEAEFVACFEATVQAN